MSPSPLTRLHTRPLLLSTALVTGVMLLTGCQNTMSTDANMRAAVPSTPASTSLSTKSKLTPAVQSVIGDYANDGYDKRQQGYDWVGVMVRPLGE